MASTLYVETNFLIAYAKGQNPFADTLLDFELWPFRLAIPNICIMESLSVLNNESKSRRDFVEKLRYQIREIERDRTSSYARGLQFHLEQAELAADLVRRDIENRLSVCLNIICSDVEHCEVIPLDASLVCLSLNSPILEDATDNLILFNILNHAVQDNKGPKAFWSENHRDFDRFSATEMLENAGIKYFRKPEAAVGWLRSQGTS